MTEKIKTIEELAETEADSDEDNGARRRPTKTSMAKPDHGWPRSILSFITTDSQMGLKQEYDSVVEKHRV
jgi:hypothetical protein